MSVFVSSGDEGAASADADESVATHGIAVSGFTSTPYNVSVGGTDFGDTLRGYDQQLLVVDQQLDLRIGAVLRSGNSVE